MRGRTRGSDEEARQQREERAFREGRASREKRVGRDKRSSGERDDDGLDGMGSAAVTDARGGTAAREATVTWRRGPEAWRRESVTGAGKLDFDIWA
ncbi:hypothetical protein PF002_g21296 [Phytophthora fragariae]|uniref:Uncharacterized protein n=1 Tax=Phytophthora fragariae TaxID=53985 RepID=A0A6A3XGG0_9STRA|nr:hypothetical protein PF002_g21296 [Phytophthora fragariae]